MSSEGSDEKENSSLFGSFGNAINTLLICLIIALIITWLLFSFGSYSVSTSNEPIDAPTKTQKSATPKESSSAWSDVDAYTVPNYKESSQSEAENPLIVYVTDTGRKYHRAGCKYLAHSSRQTTLGQAVRDGYTRCLICW